MTNPQDKTGNDWIDALELPEPDGYIGMSDRGSFIVPPRHFGNFNCYKIFTAAMLRAFARQALAESEARRQGEAVAVVHGCGGHLFIDFLRGNGNYKLEPGDILFTHPPAKSEAVAVTVAECRTDKEILEIFWKHFHNFPSTADAVTYTVWKDGIDIDKLSAPMLAYSRELSKVVANGGAKP
jgi:hypothetical protein